MVNQVWGKHTTVVTGSQDGTKQVSKNEWNENLNRKGLLGFDAETIASASSVTIPDDSSNDVSSFIKLSGSTSVDTLVTTNTSDGDLLFVLTTGSVTLNNTSSPSSAGDIRLLANANKDLSTTIPTLLMRVGNFWYEFGGGATVDAGDLTGTTLASGVVTTSATTVGALNSGSITSGFGNIDIGSSDFDTTGTVTCDVTGDVSGSSGSCTGNSATATTATNATNVALTNEATDTTCFPVFVDTATGNQDAKTNASLTFNSNTATLAATTFSGALSGNATTATNAAGLSATLISTSGGTGLASFTAGDILYYASGTTLTKLAKPGTPAGEVLTFATSASAPSWVAAAGGGFGAQQFWCDGGAFIATPSSTAGTATSYGQTRVLSNGVSVSSVVLPEHATIDSRCTFTWTPPENWDAGTILAKIYWTMQDTTTTSVGDTGAFEVSAVAISNDDTLNASFGTAVAVTDVFIATDDLHVATISGAITVGGSPANADLVQIQINRNAGSDTLEVGSNVELLGIILEYTQDASTSSG